MATNFSLAEDVNTIRCVEDNCESCELVFFKRDQAWFDKKLMPMIGDVSDNWRTINDDKNVLAIDLIKWLDGFFSHSVFWLDRKRLRYHWTKAQQGSKRVWLAWAIHGLGKTESKATN